MSDINLIAKTVRQNLKTEFPNCTFSVTISRGSMCQSLSIYLMKADFEPFASPVAREEAHCDVNHYTVRRDSFEDMNFETSARWDAYNMKSQEVFQNLDAEYAIVNGCPITRQAWDVMKRVDEIGNNENWDRSDTQVDYFDVNYYFHLGIGKWDKRFVTVETKFQKVGA